jgi:hypothetical protein
VRQTGVIWVWIGVLAVCVLAAASAQAEPKIHVLDKERVWDLTNERPNGVRIGETVEHEFVLRNEGDEPLEIIGASAGESFLTVEAPSEPIAPGGDGRVKVAFCTVGMEPSLIETHVTVRAKEVKMPVVLTVKAHVIPRPETLLVVTPQEQSVGLVRPGKRVTLRYECENAGSTDIEVRALTTQYPRIDKRFEVVKDLGPAVLKPGDTKEFELTFTPGPRDVGREIEPFFTVQTESAEQPHVKCEVRAYVARPERKQEGVQIVPRFVLGEEPRYSCRIANHTEQDAVVVALRAGEEIERVSVKAGENGSFEKNVESADALNEISLQIKLVYVSTEPEAGSEVGEEAVEETQPEAVTDTGEASEAPPAEDEATEPNEDTESEPAE